MNYVVARMSQRNRDETFRNYVADGLQAIAENTAKICGGLLKNANGKVLKERYSDLVNPKKKKEPEKSGQEIADSIIGRLAKKE